MKFLSSSPSSASSGSNTNTTTTTTTTTFDGNSRSATAGCLRGILSRLLCFNSFPTHPSDHYIEAGDEPTECDSLHYRKVVDSVEASATPGLVARLMGLDAMPQVDFANTQSSLNSITRSRSMNYVDTWRETELMQGKHMRVKSTLSFREAPAFLELENEEFFIFSFESGGQTLGSKTRKSDTSFSELKQRRLEKYSHKNKRGESVHEDNKENQETNNVSDKKLQRMVTHRTTQNVGNDVKSKDSSKILCPMKNCHEDSHFNEIVKQINKPLYNNDNTERRRSRRKKKENCSPVKKVETECDSENSSPVSVLDFAEFPIDFEAPTSVQNSRLTSSNSRKTLFEELKSYKNSSPSNSNRSIIDNREVKRIEGRRTGSWKRDYPSQNYVQIWGKVCEFAEADFKQTNWIYRDIWDLEEFEEISAAFGSEILDQLLFELVDQMSSA